MADALEKIKGCSTLPAVPAVVLEIVSLCTHVDADLDQIASLINTDPAMAARILKIANSCLFARAADVTSVERAMVRLGLRMVRMTVLSFALLQETLRNPPPSFDFQRFWKHALITANTAKCFCDDLRLRRRDEAFALGLLQDVGILALQQALPDEYEEVLAEYAREPTADLSRIETDLLGTSHAEVGAFLLEQWRLPSQIILPIAKHHAPGDLEDVDDRRMAEVLALGSETARFFLDSAKGVSHDRIRNLACSRFDLPKDRLDGILQTVDEAVRETADLFRVNVDDLPSCASLRQTAAEELTELAIQSEAARQDLAEQHEEATQQLRRLQQRNIALREELALDGLTGLINRAEIEERLRAEHARACRHVHQLAVAMVDVDHFKVINDTFGHQTGDSILRSLADFLQSTIRTADVVGRYGGDEFLIILTEPTRDSIVHAAERIRLGVQNRSPQWLDEKGAFTVSLGAALLTDPQGLSSCDVLIETADRCLYEAKKAGRNCTRYATM